MCGRGTRPHNAHNALAATSAALAAGVSLDAIKRGLESFGAVKGRLQVKRAALGTLAGATVIDDTYNANPDSMRAAIDVLARAQRRRDDAHGSERAGIHGLVQEEVLRAGLPRDLDALGERPPDGRDAACGGHVHDVHGRVRQAREIERAADALLLDQRRA